MRVKGEEGKKAVSVMHDAPHRFVLAQLVDDLCVQADKRDALLQLPLGQ